MTGRWGLQEDYSLCSGATSHTKFNNVKNKKARLRCPRFLVVIFRSTWCLCHGRIECFPFPSGGPGCLGTIGTHRHHAGLRHLCSCVRRWACLGLDIHVLAGAFLLGLTTCIDLLSLFGTCCSLVVVNSNSSPRNSSFRSS